MPDQTRPYRMQQRAQSQQQTRLRIIEAAVHLHGTLGPSRTSISALASHAGVRRSTVYRHFPDEAALFDACSAHWSTANPPPDITVWAAINDPDERLRIALIELYAFYERTEAMLDNLIRDETTMALVRQRFSAFRNYLKTARGTLMPGRMLRGNARKHTRAAVGHAIAYATWKSLVREQQLNHTEAAALAHAFVTAARR